MPYPWKPGDDLTAARLTWDLFVRKGSSTSRSEVTTRTDDPHLTLQVAANATYLFDGLIVYGATTTADLTGAWTVPSGASGVWTAWCPGSGTPGPTSEGYTIRTEARTDMGEGHVFGGIGSPNQVGALVKGTLVTSTGGTFAFQWAQFAAGSIATTVYTNSWLRLTRVA